MVKEAAVMEAVVARLLDLNTDEALAAAVEQGQPELADLEREKAAAAQAVQAVRAKLHRAGMAFSEGTMSASVYRGVEDTLTDELEGAAARYAAACEKVLRVPNLSAVRERVGEVVASLQDHPEWLRLLDPAQASRLLQAAGVRVLVEDRQVLDVRVAVA